MVELVFDLASELTQKLGSLAYDEISSAWGDKSDLQKLEATMSAIKGVLLDAEEKQAHNQEVRSWLLQVKHLFRDTEDLLDEVECEALRRQVVENFHGTSRKGLQTLLFGGCQNLQELPRDMSNLISLRFIALTTKQACFQDNGVGCLKSLRFLVIASCCSLKSLPREMSYLTALRILIIHNCEQLDLVNQHYQAIALRLEKLVLVKLPRITELPEWLQGAANTLQYLGIEDCFNLGSLPGWLTNLTSLRKLVLVSCPKLLSLPEGMDRLTALRDLKIGDCIELERRCNRNIGEDWPKITHISKSFYFRLIVE